MVSSPRVHTEPRGARPVVHVLVAAGVVMAVAAGMFVSFRAGGYALAAVLALAAVARLVLPVRVVGALAVRSRAVDVATGAAFAAALALLAGIVPSGSGLG